MRTGARRRSLGAMSDTGTLDASRLRQRLRSELTAAMRGRDRVAVAVLRTTLAAVDNAEAVEVGSRATGMSLAVEQVPVGVGATDGERLALTEADVEGIVRGELADRLRAAVEYDEVGRPDHAERMRAEAGILSAVLGG